VLAAASWAGFREQISFYHPDLVILDIGLPDADGLDVMRWLRERSVTPPPVIIVTGATSPQERSRGLDLGADDM